MISQSSFFVHPPSRKSCSASAVPHSEQISVLLSVREIAPGYSPGRSLHGIQLSQHRGHMFGIFMSLPSIRNMRCSFRRCLGLNRFLYTSRRTLVSLQKSP
jgi:hypothetical protein